MVKLMLNRYSGDGCADIVSIFN